MGLAAAAISAEQPCRILLVDDDHADAGLVRWALRKQAELPYEILHVDSLGGCLSACAARSFDIILLDLNLPESSGTALIERVASTCPGPAIIVLTGLDDAETGLQAVQAGAQDYLVKQRVNQHELCRAIRYAMERKASRDYIVRVREEFLAHVSHELRTPLTAATSAIELIRDDAGAAPLGQGVSRLLNMAQSNLVLLASMVSDLIDTTMLRSGKIRIHCRPVGVDKLIGGVIEAMTPLSERVGITLAGSPVSEDWIVVADCDRVQQVLVNLTANAIAHTPSGGTVVVEAVLDASRPGFATLSVRDTGCGIPDAALPHLFERLYQAPDHAGTYSRKGLGLGLYIASELIREHGGEIWAESALDHGSRFSFTLPLVRSPDPSRIDGV